jgi:hypothetical protein
MIFRKNDGLLIEINKSDFKNDFLFYEKIMSIKTKKEIKQKNVKDAFIVKPLSKDGAYSKQAINRLMKDFS